MRIRCGVWMGAVVMAAMMAACATTTTGGPHEQQRAPELVVGVTSDSPPYATQQGGDLAGLEVDFARELGHVLHRPVRVVDLSWDDLIAGLSNGRVDVVMAGVTVTPERQLRFAFTEPYLRTRIVALVRRADRKRLGSPDAICKGAWNIGVMAGTTGELYVRDRCPSATVKAYPSATAAVQELQTRRVDAVVHDGPVLAWLLAQNSAELDLVPTRIADEQLAWMVRRDDPQLLHELNGALATMRSDGTLDQILRQWVPQIERVRS
jgi:polar amino acid transport system substrate-binding protein